MYIWIGGTTECSEVVNIDHTANNQSLIVTITFIKTLNQRGGDNFSIASFDI